MVRNTPTPRQTDAKGRISLGEAFANRTMLVEHRDDEIILRPARVIPEREAWLYENPKALESVRRGLKQAASKALVKGPDLAASAKLAEQLRDE